MKRPIRDRVLAESAPIRPDRYTALVRMVAGGDRKLAVSLGGGSLPGLCGNLALVRILEELELRPHVGEVWGTSAGAVVGSPGASSTPGSSARSPKPRAPVGHCSTQAGSRPAACRCSQKVHLVITPAGW